MKRRRLAILVVAWFCFIATARADNSNPAPPQPGISLTSGTGPASSTAPPPDVSLWPPKPPEANVPRQPSPGDPVYTANNWQPPPTVQPMPTPMPAPGVMAPSFVFAPRRRIELVYENRILPLGRDPQRRELRHRERPALHVGLSTSRRPRAISGRNLRQPGELQLLVAIQRRHQRADLVADRSVGRAHRIRFSVSARLAAAHQFFRRHRHARLGPQSARLHRQLR